MVWVGDFYLFGKGILENYDESFKWYQKAANLGHFYAMINLGLTYAHGLGVKRNPDKAVFKLFSLYSFFDWLNIWINLCISSISAFGLL